MLKLTVKYCNLFSISSRKILKSKIKQPLGVGFSSYESKSFEKKIIRRSLLYVPGQDLKKIKKLSQIKVDCAVLDCEDGVGIECKELARTTIKKVYEQISALVSGELAIRINPPGSSFAKDDISTLFDGEILPKTVVVPKINCFEELCWACELLETAMRQSRETLNIIIMVESARGLIDIKEILGLSMSNLSSRFRIEALIFGSDDFCADLGITRSDDASELQYARQKLVATAKAFGIGVIDMVYIDYKDSIGLARQAAEGFRMGFTGKQVIHPAQVPIVQKAFSPTPEQVAWARELLDAYEQNKQGVFTFRGQMIDRPTLLQAHNIVSSASCDI